MTMSAEKADERTVDSLKQIYSVVIALAISFAVQTMLLDRTANAFSLDNSVFETLPKFMTFLLVLIPFYHGMNRHLDICYVARAHSEQRRGWLVFDILAFFVESSIFFAVASSMKSGLNSFVLLGILLGVDMLWAFVSELVHYKDFKPSVVRWAFINLITVSLGLFVVFRLNYSQQLTAWLLFFLGVARLVADYATCWRFYFHLENARV